MVRFNPIFNAITTMYGNTSALAAIQFTGLHNLPTKPLRKDYPNLASYEAADDQFKLRNVKVIGRGSVSRGNHASLHPHGQNADLLPDDFYDQLNASGANKVEVLKKYLPVGIPFFVGRENTIADKFSAAIFLDNNLEILFPDLYIPAVPTVSRAHGYFIVDKEKGVCFVDNFSRNGTFIDDDKVQPKALNPITEGSRLRFGPNNLMTLNFKEPEQVETQVADIFPDTDKNYVNTGGYYTLDINNIGDRDIDKIRQGHGKLIIFSTMFPNINEFQKKDFVITVFGSQAANLLQSYRDVANGAYELGDKRREKALLELEETIVTYLKDLRALHRWQKDGIESTMPGWHLGSILRRLRHRSETAG